MKIKWAFLAIASLVMAVLSGCDRLAVLNPKGPQAKAQAHDILLSMGMMAIVVIVVMILLIYMLTKYRASKQSKDYEPPHIEGHPLVEALCVGIPVIMIIFLSIMSVKTNYEVEAKPTGYENQKPLVIYAASSDWKWHFSYPEENIETVNYLFIPTNRPIEFKLYSYGPITSFWIPQLGGQKYAMSDMVNTLYLAADVPGEFMGRNANFSGKGFAENTFNVKAMSEAKYEDWVKEVKETAKPLTKKKFDELLKPGHLGQSTYTGTHLKFSPAPEGHMHGGNDSDSNSSDDHMDNMDHMDMSSDKDMNHNH